MQREVLINPHQGQYTAEVIKRKSSYFANKELARELVHARLGYFAPRYGLLYNRVAIRNQKSRWGSCSSKKNLNFNYRIIFLEPHLVDYIIVHELCHLAEFNHSQKFWSLVAQAIPDWQKMRKELKSIRMR
jgi:predicted metal-dependent hydrolase